MRSTFRHLIHALIFHLSIGSPLNAQDCTCLVNLEAMAGKIEANYAGFPAALKNKGQLAYDNALNIARQRAQKARSKRDCFESLQPYVRFFGDAHLGLNYLNISAKEYEQKVMPVDLVRSLKYFKNVAVQSIEGLWKNASNHRTLLIEYDPTQKGRYLGLLVTEDSLYKKGQVFYTFTGGAGKYVVHSIDHFSSNVLKAKQRGNLLYIDNTLWIRQAPFKINGKEAKELQMHARVKNHLYFDQPAEGVAYLKVTSFANNESQIDSFVQSHAATIQQSELLIIDLRGNGGGSTGWFSLMPFLHTQTFVQGVTETRISTDNKKQLEQYLQSTATMEVPEGMEKYFTKAFLENKLRELKQLETYQGDFFPVEGVNIPFDTVYPQPKAVALLVDEGTGSSAEYFMHLSKQSNKTKTLGRPTMGIMDYLGQSNPTPLPCPDLYLVIPTERSSWTATAPTNGTGMVPDILLDSIDELDWIDATIKIWKEDPWKK